MLNVFHGKVVASLFLALATNLGLTGHGRKMQVTWQWCGLQVLEGLLHKQAMSSCAQWPDIHMRVFM